MPQTDDDDFLFHHNLKSSMTHIKGHKYDQLEGAAILGFQIALNGSIHLSSMITVWFSAVILTWNMQGTVLFLKLAIKS